MKDEIKKLLEKLKDDIPQEEYRSEGTSDGLTHYEEDKDSWQYKLYNYITKLQDRNKELVLENISLELGRNTYKSRNEKAIEVLKNTMYPYIAKAKALNILQGEDKQ